MRKPCRHPHCHRVACRPRGLCWTHYLCPAISRLYPTQSRFAPRTATAGPECWCCGTTAPAKHRVGLRVAGWFCRWTRYASGHKPELEIYCPPCFGAWGWLPETHITNPFSADEVIPDRETRLAVYAERAAAELPLFAEGPR